MHRTFAAALLLFAAFVVAPALGQSAPGETECGCKDLEELMKQHKVASILRQRYLEKADKLTIDLPRQLRNTGHIAQITALDEYIAWKKSTMPGGLLEGLPPVKRGPPEYNMDPRICDLSESDKAKIETFEDCKAIADADFAHEQHHRDRCVTLKAAYSAYPPALDELAREEAEAYGIQAEMLRYATADVLARRASLIYDFVYEVTGSDVYVLASINGRTTGAGAGQSVIPSQLAYAESNLSGTLVTFPAKVHFTHGTSGGGCDWQMDPYDLTGRFHLFITEQDVKFRYDWPMATYRASIKCALIHTYTSRVESSPAMASGLLEEIVLKDRATTTSEWKQEESGTTFHSYAKVTLACKAN